jgi:excisionase family DNA binding protein
MHRKFYSTAQIAEIFGVSRQHINRLVNRGDLPAVWVGGTIRVPEDALTAFISKGGVKPNQFDYEKRGGFASGRRTASRR